MEEIKKKTKKKRTVSIYQDGAVVRLNNKRITFVEKDGKIAIQFKFATTNAEKPASAQVCHRGKVRETLIKLSDEAMDGLMYAYQEYKRKKLINKEIDSLKNL